MNPALQDTPSCPTQVPEPRGTEESQLYTEWKVLGSAQLNIDTEAKSRSRLRASIVSKLQFFKLLKSLLVSLGLKGDSEQAVELPCFYFCVCNK